MDFDFTTDSESHAFCLAIADAMAAKFAIGRDEAITRINRLWAGTTFVGDEDIIYHRPESYWVEHIYEFYEDRIRDGTADAPREWIIEEVRRFWDRCLNSHASGWPTDRRGVSQDE